MKAIGYIRCSTHEQADSGLGLEAQAERIRAYAKLKGLEHVEIITDAAVSGGKPLASREGGQRTGTIPYGCNLADDGVTLIPNEFEQAVIRDIRAMRAAGKTLEQIADTLTKQGIPTKTGKSARWTHQAVARIVNRSA